MGVRKRNRMRRNNDIWKALMVMGIGFIWLMLFSICAYFENVILAAIVFVLGMATLNILERELL